MSQTTRVLLCLGALLVLLPLALKKPGWPAGLKADEPAYYLMSMSLAHDFDLELDLEDVHRLFDEYPYSPTRNLILATDDGWNTIYFGKPYIYSLFAAPLARLFGANGLLLFNSLLMMGMIFLGTSYLRAFNAHAMAGLFSAGFFLLSVGFSYVFWLQPEIFNMAGIMACLYLGLTPSGRRPLLRLALSGAVLVLAAYNKPMLVLLGIPVFLLHINKRNFKGVVSWTLGAVVSLGLVVGISMALIGHPTAYLGMERGGKTVCSRDQLPIEPTAKVEKASAQVSGSAESSPGGEVASPPRASWYWMFRVPSFVPREVLENLSYFFWGRHTGLFLYFPFSLLCLALFFFHARRSKMRWTLLLSIAAVAAVFLLWIPQNWQGGGGFVGNRYFVNVYPAFLFLVTRISPRATCLVGYGLASLLLAPTVLTPMGRGVPWPTMQAHVRNFPFHLFPLELSLREIPGYRQEAYGGASLKGRQDVFLPWESKVWLHGATEVEIWIQSLEELSDLRFVVDSPARPNEIVLRIGDVEQTLDFTTDSPPGSMKVELNPEGPSRIRSKEGTIVYAYRLQVTSRTGAVRIWTHRYPPRSCDYFAYDASTEESFYVGAVLSYLGQGEDLARDLYDVEWKAVEIPEQVAPSEEFTIVTQVANASGESWPDGAPARVSLSYRWEDSSGKVIVKDGLRTFLGRSVEPGGSVTVEQIVRSPEVPGSYRLVVDLVYEMVAWFSSRNGDDVWRAPVRVEPPPEPEVPD